MNYVYALVDPRTGQPFYIGKGKYERWLRTIAEAKRGGCSRNQRHIREMVGAGVEPEVRLLSFHFNEQEALDAEARLIATLPGLTNKMARGLPYVPKGLGRPRARRFA